MRVYIVDLNTSGGSYQTYLTHRDGSLTLYTSFYWGPTKKTWDLGWGKSDNGAKVKNHPLTLVDCS